MIIDKINFLKIYIFLNALFFTLLVESKEFNYKFHWLYSPVANLSINFNEYLSVDDEIKYSKVEFKLSTQGPLKLYRNYYSEGSITSKNLSEYWDYNLIGKDRGEPEEKSIRYFVNRMPVIRNFIDDSGVSPIIVDPVLDKNAIDPFSVLFRTIYQLRSKQQCQNEFTIMDGKRRYKIIVDLEEKIVNYEKKKNEIQEIIYYCKFRFSYLREEKRKWPFNKKDRYLDVWFSSKLDYKPIRFYSKTPIGSIVGNYVIDRQR